ncbi:MAG: seg [Parcubacteria group bacterium]|nr:seg [Parcubacteria group bacterium]
MEPNTEARLAALEEKIDKIYTSVEKTRKYFLWTMITSVVLFVVPLIGIAFALPSFMTNYVGSLQGLQ